MPSFSQLVDDALDRSILLGYARTGLAVRRHLAGWPADPPPVPGSTVLITGATGGLGLAAACGFARLGARVLLLGRDPAKAAAAVEAVDAAGGPGSSFLRCDLASRASLEALLDDFPVDRLDVLVHNAGVMARKGALNDDGLGLTFATNVLAPYVLTRGLTDRLAGGGRVVTVSSGGMYGQMLIADDLQALGVGPVACYARSKRAQVVLSGLWAEQLADRGVAAYAMHPGWADTPGIQGSLAGFATVAGPLLRTPEQGADTIVWLGAAPDLPTGGFWHDRRRRPEHLFGRHQETEADRAALLVGLERLAG